MNKSGETLYYGRISRPTAAEGTVELKVRVLEGALRSKQGPGKVVNGGSTATVKVGNDDAVDKRRQQYGHGAEYCGNEIFVEFPV